nr:pentatricopeptide repeat-containing protein At2g35130-like isoform X1 [Ipomoea batatas]
MLFNLLFTVFRRSRSVRSSVELDLVCLSKVLASYMFTIFIRSRSAKISSAELVVVVSLPQRRMRKKKQLITPIPDFASEKSQRRVSDLKNRVGELQSEIKAATANEAKQIKESMKRKRFRGTATEIDPPPPPNFAVKKHLRSKLPRKIFDDYSSAYSELQSDILQESSDLDFSEYRPSVWYDSGSQFSEKSISDDSGSQFHLSRQFSEEYSISDEISLELEEEDGECLHEIFVALIHLYGSKGLATRGLEILAAMENLKYDINQAWLILVEEFVQSNHLENANKFFLLKQNSKLYHKQVKEELCLVERRALLMDATMKVSAELQELNKQSSFLENQYT